ncbi:MAG TPA: OmpA family protein [bacterium]|nr:OmpA family protein [bacterium]
MKVRSLLFILVSACAALLPVASPAATSFDSLSFKPADDHGYFLVTQQSQTLGKWGWAAGLTTEFSNDSLVLKNAAGARIQDVIDDQIALQAGGALGVADWLNVGLNVSFVPLQRFTRIAPPISDDGARMGDVRLDFKARIVDNEKHPVGLSVVPFVTFPTGSDSHFVGNGKFTGGALAVLDSKRIADRVSLALNVGAQLRDEVTLSPGTTIGHQLLYSAAGNVAIVKKKLEGIVDVNGWTTFDNFFDSNNRNLELNGALRFFPIDKLAVTAGAGTGLQDGAGAPDFRAFLTVAYRHPREEKAAPPPPEPAPAQEEVITTNRIHFAFNKAAIRPESYPVIDEILASIQGRPEIESVRVEGHADSVGSDAYNQKLSDQRANAVRTYMTDKGYPADKVTAVGMGESAPIADNATKSGRAQNRRVEFHLQIKSGAHIKVKKKGEESPTFQEGDPIKDKK